MIVDSLKVLVKKQVRKLIQLASGLFIPPLSKYSGGDYRFYGQVDKHCFVGYYDIDPVGGEGDELLCHAVSADYSNSIEPGCGDIGFFNIETGEFNKICETSALNWQLGSRVQWLGNNNIIFNDIINGIHCSKIVEYKTGDVVKVFDRSFWAISPDNKIGASLNFSRISKKRPGYGYRGKSIDGDDEVLTLFSLKDGHVLYSITLKEILEKIGFESRQNTDPYLNHVAWSPSSQKLLTIFHFEETITSARKIYPVLIDYLSNECKLIHEKGYFSHHVWIDDEKILAYLMLNDRYCFALWDNAAGWAEVKGSLPQLDGHPSLIKYSNKIIVDGYPNCFGKMMLYRGSLDSQDTLEPIAAVLNPISFNGALRCDLHPRVSTDNEFIICDTPSDNGRKIMLIKGVINEK